MNGNPRVRRLRSDFRIIQEIERKSEGMFSFKKYGNPPDRYDVTLTGIQGIYMDKSKNIKQRRKHKFRITLPSGYPYKAPVIVFKTAIFHPNIYQNGTVCVADTPNWDPSKNIGEVLIEIINRIQYIHKPNFNSPADTIAKMWAKENEAWIENFGSQALMFPPRQVSWISEESSGIEWS